MDLRLMVQKRPSPIEHSRIVAAFFLIAIISSSYTTVSSLFPSPVQVVKSNPVSIAPAANNTTRITTNTTRLQYNSQAEPSLVLLSAEDFETMSHSIDFIRLNGGEIMHLFPTHVLIARIPLSSRNTLVGNAAIVQVTNSVVDPSQVAAYGQNATIGVMAWNNNFMGQDAKNGLQPPPDFKEPGPIQNDTFIALDLPSGISTAAPYGATFYDTSEYMIGTVSVAIILPESNGAIDTNQENWASNDITSVVSEIQAGLNWWAAREPNAHLSFTYTTSITATSYEPIRRPQTDENLWIGEVMANKGYTTNDYFYRVRSYLNDLRNRDKTNWAFAIFVAHSYWDVDGLFADGYFAYAYLGGPFIVMTYDNDGYGLSNMDAVTAHETGHIFYALDQYTEAGQPCTKKSGYLNIENQNSAYPSAGSCLSNVASIMRSQVSPYTAGAIDQYARQQVGWRDSDGDGRLDIVDLFPDNSLNPYTPDPTTDHAPTYTGQATSRSTYPNNNPYGQGHAITINTISSVQYWVEDLSGNRVRQTQDASPVDGTFDSDLESYTFSVTPALPDGTYKIFSVAWNTQGNGLVVSDQLSIITAYSVTFAESGIPSGVAWGVTVGGTHQSTSSSTSITLNGLVGTVFYSYDSPVAGSGGSYVCSSGCSGSVSGPGTVAATYVFTQLTQTLTATVTLTTTQTSTLYSAVATSTVTSYTSTSTSTSTIPIVTTVVLVPVTSTVQSTQAQTSLLTTTVTNYTSTSTSTSMVPTVTTVTIGPPTSTIQTTQMVTSIGTATVTGVTTITITSYTGTQTSTSTTIVVTTVTTTGSSFGEALALLSMVGLAVTFVVEAGKGRVIPEVLLRVGRRCLRS